MKKFFTVLLYVILLGAWVFGLIFFIPVFQDFTATAEAENFFLTPFGRFLIWEIPSLMALIILHIKFLEKLEDSDAEYNEQHKQKQTQIELRRDNTRVDTIKGTAKEVEVYTKTRDHYGIVCFVFFIFAIVIAPFDLLIHIFKTLAN